MDPHLIANVFMEAFEEEAISISEKKLTCYISFTRKKIYEMFEGEFNTNDPYNFFMLSFNVKVLLPPFFFK